MPPGPPPMPIVAAEVGPPAGKVELVAWPSVWTAQDAGAASRTLTPANAMTRRTRAEFTRATPIAAASEAQMINVEAHDRSVALWAITTASVKAPAVNSTGPQMRFIWETPAPTSSAVNGASADT